MAEPKPALVLHLATGGEPLLFALAAEESEKFAEKLDQLLRTGAVETVPTREDVPVTINFAQVAVAYIDDLQRHGKVFGLH